jgi:hypothetical protein
MTFSKSKSPNRGGHERRKPGKTALRVACLMASLLVVASAALGAAMLRAPDLEAVAPGDVHAPRSAGAKGGTVGPPPANATPKQASPKHPPPIVSPKPLHCHNSVNPKCGSFYWSPAPGPNAPIEVTVEYAPANPTVGEEIVFTITVLDPDARQLSAYAMDFGGPGGGGPVLIPPLCIGPRPTGPWTPPDKEAGEITKTIGFTYSSSGTFTAKFYADSGTNTCQPLNPYASDAAVSLVVAISPKSTATPSPEPTSTESPAPIGS